MADLVKAEYQTFEVMFSEEGWFNATAAAEKFGKRVDHYLANAETKEYIDALSEGLNTRKVGYLENAEERVFLKTKRGKNGGTWFHPDLAVHFARWLDVRFAIWCDRQIKQILTGTHPHHDWKRLRHEATASYKVMAQILQMTRQRLGKTCAPHHFSNESRLINWALTGTFGKLDREGLSPGDLDLLAKLENLDSVLLGCSANYEDRKQELERFAREQRTAHIKEIAA